MKRILVGLIVILIAARAPGQSPPGEQEPRGAGAPPPPAYKFPAYVPIVETPGLPRVLILGDSISIGYMLPVRARLKGRANVLRPAENCADTGTGIKQLDTWLALGHGHWDVIHFNFGLHDIKYLDAKGRYVSPDKGKQVTTLVDYESNLRALVTRMKQTGATLICATTTPVPTGASGRVEADPARYNEVAKKVMRDLGVTVDDLFAAVTPQQAKLQVPRNVHFTPAGYECLADAVTASIEHALSPAAK